MGVTLVPERFAFHFGTAMGRRPVEESGLARVGLAKNDYYLMDNIILINISHVRGAVNGK